MCARFPINSDLEQRYLEAGKFPDGCVLLGRIAWAGRWMSSASRTEETFLKMCLARVKRSRVATLKAKRRQLVT